MSNWIYLEVAIGLVLVYFIISLLCTTLTELISRWLALRARTLKDAIYHLLNDTKKKENNTFTDINIFNHPLFKGLSPKDPPLQDTETLREKHWWDNINIFGWQIFKKNHYGPSEIPPSTFAQIVFDTIAGPDYKVTTPANIDPDTDTNNEGGSKSLIKAACKTVNDLETKIESLQVNEDTKKTLRSFLVAAKTKVTNWDGVIKEFRTSLEKWFDDSMQRVTGWYARKTQLIVLGLALIICFTLNIDSFGIAKSLYTNPALRETVVTAAEAQVKDDFTPESFNLTYSQTMEKLDSLNLPIGWNAEPGTTNTNPDTGWGWLLKIAGILVTAFAASLGSGFWFDLLKKLVNIRAAGKTPEKTEEKKSESG